MSHADKLDRPNGLKLLSIDAGGPRSISQLVILADILKNASKSNSDIQKSVMRRPCEEFDVIGGVGTGGLIAMFLVLLKMSAEEALDEFKQFAIVFKDVEPDPILQSRKLELAIHGILGRRKTDDHAKLVSTNQAEPTCKLIVPIMYKNHVGAPCILKNYVTRDEPSTDLTITEAMLATCAISPLFTPVRVSKDFCTFEYISGDIGLSNPLREVISSTHRLFGDKATVACLLSIGGGHQGVNSVPSDSSNASRINFLERIAMDSEKTAREISVQMGHLTLYHRFSVGYGLESRQVNAWGDPESIIARTVTYLQDSDINERIERCVGAINSGDATSTLEQLARSGGQRYLAQPLPYLTPIFVERKIPMAFVQKTLFREDGHIKPGSKILTVTGIGGCGKTELVRNVSNLYCDHFSSVCYADGTREETIQRDIIRHVQSLDPAHGQQSFKDAMLFLSQPTIKNGHLLIIDNVDDPSLKLDPYFPRWRNGVTIITSRNHSLGQLSPGAHLQLDVMSPEESVELLVRGRGREWPCSESDRQSAAAVASELGYHPIAMVQAISYMFTTEISPTTYISRLHTSRERVLGDPATGKVGMRYTTAFAAFDASYQQLPPRVQGAFSLLSFFHRRRFPVELVTLAAENNFETDEQYYLERDDANFELGKACLSEVFNPLGRWDPFELDIIIRTLRNHSLIRGCAEPKGGSESTFELIQMHSLVSEWARLRIPKEDHERFQSAAVRLLCCGAAKDNYAMIQYLSIHVKTIYPICNYLHVNDAASFAQLLREAGAYAHATPILKDIYATLKIRVGPDHHSTINASAHLAANYSDLGLYSKAEVLETKVLRQRVRKLGIDHPLTNQADFRDAIRDSIPPLIKLLKDQNWIVRSDASLTLGKIAEAEPDITATQIIRTLSAYASLAVTYGQMGKYAAAKPLMIEVQRQTDLLFGADHPSTLHASANLASVHGELGEYTEAEALKSEVLRRRIRLLGADHPDTIHASAHLATIYRELGRYEDAERLDTDVTRRRRKLLGEEHPDTISACAKLAETYRLMERYADAEELGKDVIKRQTSRLGEDHPDTIKAYAGLAATYYRQGRFQEAVCLEEMVLERDKRLLGAEHPDTVNASANLAASYHDLGRFEEAEMLQDEVLKVRTSQLGDQHPETLRAMLYLARTYKDTQRPEKAFQLATQACCIASKTLGEGHTLYRNASVFLAPLVDMLNSSGDDNGNGGL